MANEVVWTKRATDDLYHIFEALSTFSDAQAEIVVEAIIERVFVLEQFPKMGRVVPELNIESVRELIIQRYRVIYTLTKQETVEVLAVRHSSRPLSDI